MSRHRCNYVEQSHFERHFLELDNEASLPIRFPHLAIEADGKSKNDHFLLLEPSAINRLRPSGWLFEWYGSWQNLKLVHRLGLTFYTTLKANRLQV